MATPQETIEPMRTVHYQESETGADESGPFFLYSPGESLYRLSDTTHGLDKVIAGSVAFLDKSKVWYGAEQVPEGAEQRKRQILDERRRVTDRFSQIHIPAAANRDRLLDMYRDRGLIELRAFAGMTAEAGVEEDKVVRVPVHLNAFNQLIAPVPIHLGKITDEKLLADIERHGALALRLDQVRRAKSILNNRGEVREQLGDDLANRYAQAIDQILPSFEAYKIAADLYLKKQENEVKKGRKEYDPRDFEIMWLLAKKPQDEALARALQGPSGGLDAEGVRALIEEFSERREAAAPAPQAAIETMQCPECGSVINMVAGGPPRKCLPCGFRFDTPDPTETKAAAAKRDKTEKAK